MIILIAAAALAAQPAGPAQASPAQHEQHIQMGEAADHKAMDCCKDCCKDMAKKHEGHSEHDGHTGE